MVLSDTGADKRIDEQLRVLRQGLLERADEYRQVWNIIMDVFSQIVEVLGKNQSVRALFRDIGRRFCRLQDGLIPPPWTRCLSNIERAKS